MNRKYGPYLKWLYHVDKQEDVVLFFYTDNWIEKYDVTRLNEKSKKCVKVLKAVGKEVVFWYREDLSNGDVIIHWSIE